MTEYIGKEYLATGTDALAKVIMVTDSGGKLTIGIKWISSGIIEQVNTGVYCTLTNFPLDEFLTKFKEKK